MKKFKAFFLMIFLVLAFANTTNVFAATEGESSDDVSSVIKETKTVVTTVADYLQAITNKDLEEIKLGANITLSDQTGISNQFIVGTTDRTLDLAGFKLDVGSHPLVIARTNYDGVGSQIITITDSSESGTGMICSEDTTIDYLVRLYSYGTDSQPLNIVINGGSYYFGDNAKEGSTILKLHGNDIGAVGSIVLTVRNAKFKGRNLAESTDSENNEATITIESAEFLGIGTSTIVKNSSKKLSDIMSIGSELYINGIEEKDLTKLASSISVNDNETIVFKKKIGLSIDNVYFGKYEYDYDPIEPKAIRILNAETDKSVTIASVTVNLPNEFEVSGTTTPTIEPLKYNDTDFTIKPVQGLSLGVHRATITVTDSDGNAYSAEVIFTVEKGHIYPSVSLDDWEYGEAKEPVIEGNKGMAHVTYEYEGINGTVYEKSSQKPELPGTYRLTIRIAESVNYYGAETSVEFTITKKKVTVRSTLITPREFDNTADINEDLIDVDLSETLIYTKSAVLKDENQKYVGTDIPVIISVKLSDDDFVKYNFIVDGESSQTIDVESKINITVLKVSSEYNVSGIDAEATTTLKVRIGSSLELKDLINVTSNNNSLLNEAIYKLVNTYEGVTINGINLITTNSATPDSYVRVRYTISPNDYNGDGVNETEGTEKDFYVKVLDKEIVTISGLTYNDKEYDGTPIVPEGTLTVTDDKVPVSTLEITYNGINGTVYENTTVAPTEVGNYKVTYKVPDSNIDYKGSVSYEYSITQATPDYTLPSDLSGILNNKLSTVTLPNGFEWTDENIVMSSSGTQKYAGKFVPSDQKNYKIVNVEISVYVKGIFSVTTSVEGGNGTITASKNDIVEGSNFEIEFTPDEYYIIDTVTLNGEDVTANVLDYKLTILDIKENKTVVVKYREKDKIDPPYTVVTGLEGNENDKLETITLPNDQVGVWTWKDKNVTLSKTVGKYAAIFTPNDTRKYKTIEVLIDVNVKGLFSVTTSVEGGNGTITETKTNIVEGSNFEVTFTPDEYYVIDIVTLNGIDVTSSVTNSKLTITDIRENKIVVVKYREQDKIYPPYAEVKTLIGIENNELSTITLPEDPIGVWRWKDASTKINRNIYKYTAVFTPNNTRMYKTVEVELDVVVTLIHKVTTSVVAGNGTISESKNDIVNGSSFEVTFTPDLGYMVDTVKVNGIDTVISSNKLLIENITEDKIVEVSYKKIPFTITINEVKNATIDPSGAIAVLYGDNKDINISANYGYKLVSIKVNGIEKIDTLVEGVLSLVNITENMKVDVVVEKIEYKVIEGKNQILDITENGDLVFKFDVDFSLFKDAYVDNVLLDVTDYKAESGSTIITLKNAYLKTLSVGEHTLKTTYIDGGEGNVKFKITKPSSDDNSSIDSSSSSELDNPGTYDGVLSYILLGGVSLAGIIGVCIYLKRKHN